MSEEQLKAFLEKVKGDTSLQEKLKRAVDTNTVAEIAKNAGFTISADDLKQAQSKVSDEELEGASGGLMTVPPHPCGENILRRFSLEIALLCDHPN
ncbi:Nif11-like leader peptide family natural product precursor [Synechococcus sp. UW179A]|uniref:Nif11-like leader peptide family natural product precursor n=1 Tax=Synechococcus sp. UW179A TaxID=2575510 RepID=UPI000E0F8B0A|nr:Nif11-like leader peptide family natural product precursor [Synechococcus sp. UW179A]